MGGVSDEVLIARAFLNRVAEPACIPLWKLVRDLGPVEAVQRVRAGRVGEGIARAVAGRLPTIDPEADLAAGARHGLHFVVPESEHWPHFAMSALERAALDRVAEYEGGKTQHALYGEPIPPLALWARGPADLASLGVRSVGIVGARSATRYGEQVASDLAYGLARREFAVVSGGAYGIDAAAHRGALAAGGTTVLVSAGGLDSPYPPSHTGLFDRVATTGLLLSESPPGSTPQRRRFLTRNRLIAALATGTVVVEASLRSGASNTAGHCTRLQRPLMAVPGPVTSAVSAGCHALINADDDPARLVTGVDDVVALIGSASDVPAIGSGREPSGDDLRGRLDLLDDVSRHVFDGFRAGRVLTCDELAVASGVNALDVIRALPALQLAGLVEGVDGGFRISAAVARASRRRAVGPK